jgi:hypothetical protein
MVRARLAQNLPTNKNSCGFPKSPRSFELLFPKNFNNQKLKKQQNPPNGTVSPPSDPRKLIFSDRYETNKNPGFEFVDDLKPGGKLCQHLPGKPTRFPHKNFQDTLDISHQ